MLTDRALDCETGDRQISRRSPHLPRIIRLPCLLFCKDPCPPGPLLGSLGIHGHGYPPANTWASLLRRVSVVTACQCGHNNLQLQRITGRLAGFVREHGGWRPICLAAEQCRANPHAPSRPLRCRNSNASRRFCRANIAALLYSARHPTGFGRRRRNATVTGTSSTEADAAEHKRLTPPGRASHAPLHLAYRLKVPLVFMRTRCESRAVAAVRLVCQSSQSTSRTVEMLAAHLKSKHLFWAKLWRSPPSGKGVRGRAVCLANRRCPFHKCSASHDGRPPARFHARAPEGLKD